MIDFSTINKKFDISSIYKPDYVIVHKIYNHDFEQYSRTLFYLLKKLSEFVEADSNLENFFKFFMGFRKICNKIPISFLENALFNETNKSFDHNKTIKILSAVYPEYDEDFIFISKKYIELKNSKTNPFFSNTHHEKNNEKNLFLVESELNKKLKWQYKFFKDNSYFYKIYNQKLETVSLFNPSLELLQEIVYSNISEFINVYNFDWLKIDYSNLCLFVSNQNIKIRPINIKFLETPKPLRLLDNKLLGEIVQEDIMLSSDLDAIISRIEKENQEEEEEINEASLKDMNNLEKIKSTLVQLSNGKIAFLKNQPGFDQMQDVVVKSITGKVEVKSKKVDLIKIGEFLVFQGERATSMLEEEATLNYPESIYFYSQRKDWKHRLESEINRLGLEKVIKKIQEFGGRKKISVNNIKYWIYPNSLRTDDKITFSSIMKLCGLYNKAEEIWNNMGELEKAHLQAGKIIKNKIKDTISKTNINQLIDKGFQEFSLRDSSGGGSLYVYKIIKKGKTLKVKFSYTDKPLDPSEFLS